MTRFVLSLIALSAFASIGRSDAGPMGGSQVGDTAKPEALFAEICAAVKKNAQDHTRLNRVRVRPGLYAIPSVAGTDNSAVWRFSGENALHDCIVDLTGVTLAFGGSSGTNLEFAGCTDSIFRGATVYKPIPSFTQGTIVALNETDAENWQVELQIDKGYLVAPFVGAGFTVHVFDPTIRDGAGRPAWKAGIEYFHTQSITATDVPGKLKLTFKGRTVLARPVVGDRLVLRSKGGFSTTVQDCTGMTFQNLKLGNNGLYGIVEFRGRGTIYDHVQITYGPPPPGAVEQPIVASSADGIHCLYGDPGPTFKNCLIEGTPDDGIAIHGGFYPVDQVISDTVVGLKGAGNQPKAVQRFDKGDTMRISDETSHYYADAVVIEAKQVEDTWQYTLDRAVQVKPDFLVANPKKCGHGFKIIGTTIRRNRARGMLLKADDGLIENNLVDGSTIAGIVLSPEVFRGGGEAGYVHNVVIRGNTIRHTGYAESGLWTGYAPGISVTGCGSIGNRNITIANNTFDRIPGANLMVRWTDTALIEGNSFLHTHQVDSHIGEGQGIDPHAVIWIGDGRNVTLSNNVVARMGPFGKSLLTVAPSATGVQGVQDGISRAK